MSLVFLTFRASQQGLALLWFLFVCFFEKVSLCPWMPGTHCVEQAGRELALILLPLPSHVVFMWPHPELPDPLSV